MQRVSRLHFLYGLSLQVNSKLKPCPFCGNDKLTHQHGGHQIKIVCRRTTLPANRWCGASTDYFDFEKEAEKAWNMRTEDKSHGTTT